MHNGEYAVAQAADIPALPAEPQVRTKRRLLDEFLRNPFLDEDILGLALRVGASRAETESCLASLGQEGLLKEAGRRGYMLDLGAVGTRRPVPPIAARRGSPDQTAVEPSRAEETPPLGLILMRADGQAELVDEQAAAWLGVSAAGLDAATFEILTGVDPALMLGGAPRLSFTLSEPQPLLVTMHACCLGSEPGVLIVLQEAHPRPGAMRTEMAAVQTCIQEELFERLQGEMVEPVMLIQQFLENPDPEGLGQARAALEQVNQFLEEFLLEGRNGNPG